MGLLFTADLHFFHRSILEYCPQRPWRTVEEMNVGLIERWNEAVRPSDTVYMLGDFALGGSAEQLHDLFVSLAGHKHLVLGNHDERNERVLKLPWESQSALRTVRFEGHRFVVCHYPLETWKSAQHGYLHCHGHSHGTLKRQVAHRFDVGVDCWEYAPVTVARLIEFAGQQTFDPQDHHGD
jgi:calcineurin-like phosphoesterase family protein